MLQLNITFSLRLAARSAVAVLLLLSALPVAALPKCSDMDTDPSLFACSCLETDSTGNLIFDENGDPIRIPRPDRCGDMLSGQRTLVRADDLIVATPTKQSSSPTKWVTQNKVYQTMPWSTDKNLGDFNSEGDLHLENHPGCQTNFIPSPQRTRVGRLYDLTNDVLVTLTALNSNVAKGCEVSGSSHNLDVHIRDTLGGESNVGFSFSASADFIQMALADFNFDGFDDVLVLAKDKFVIATADDPSTFAKLEVHETSADLSLMLPLNEPTTGDFNGDGLIDVIWIGGSFMTEDGDLTVFSATVCPGDVPDNPICDGAEPFDVVMNPAAKITPNVKATSSFSLANLPGLGLNNATFKPNYCSTTLGVSAPVGSLRAGAVVLGNFDDSNGLGLTGQPIDELIVSYVSGNGAVDADRCSTDIWLFNYVIPSSKNKSWLLPNPDANSFRNFPEAETKNTSSYNDTVAITLHAKAAQLDWLSGREQAIIAVGGGKAGRAVGVAGLFVITSYQYPMSVNVVSDNGLSSATLEVCAAHDHRKSKPTSSGKFGTRILWGMSVGRYTSTTPDTGDTSCSDAEATEGCPFDLQIATLGSELEGLSSSANRLDIWSLKTSDLSDSSKQCSNDDSLITNYLPTVEVAHSVDIAKVWGGMDRAGSMLQVGDLRGNSIRVGPPTIVRISSHSQPIVMLQTPPSHIDYLAPIGESTPSLLNLSAASDVFNTSYDDQTSTQQGSSHQQSYSHGFSLEQSIGVKVATSEVPFLATVSVSDTQTFDEAASTVSNKSLGQFQTKNFSLNVGTGIRDAVRWEQTAVNVFHYPIIGSQTCPQEIVCSTADANSGSVICDDDIDPVNAIVLNLDADNSYPNAMGCEFQTADAPAISCPSTPTIPDTTACNTDSGGNACCIQQTGTLNYVLSGPEEVTQKTSPGSILEWYQPPQVAGQLFSYPASVALAELRFGRTQGTSTPAANNLTKGIAYDTGTGALTERTSWKCTTESSASLGSNSSFSMKNDYSVTAGSSDSAIKAGVGAQVSVSLSEAYSTSNSSLNTASFSSTESSGIQVNIERALFLTPLEDYTYSFTPFAFGASPPASVADNPPTTVCSVDNINCSAAQEQATDCSTTGPLLAGYSVSVDEVQSSWWGARYAGPGNFDLALTNPQRWQLATTTTVDKSEEFNRCRGTEPALECAVIQAPSAAPVDPSNPTPREVSDIWVNSFYSLRGLRVTVEDSTLGSQRVAAEVGDTVFLSLRVFNYSLTNFPAGTKAFARFYRQKVDPTLNNTNNVVGLQGYVGAPVVILAQDGITDKFSFNPPPGFSSAAENYVNVVASYLVDETEEDSYWIYWVSIWLEDENGNVVNELANHGLGNSFSPKAEYLSIAQVPLTVTEDGSSYSNNVGMYKQVFYIAKNSTSASAASSANSTSLLFPPRAGELSIVGLHTSPVLPRPFSPVVIAADVFSHERETEGVTVMFAEQDISSTEPSPSELTFEVEHLPHVRKNSSHFVRAAYRPEHCGRNNILVEAVALNSSTVADTSFIVPCELAPKKIKGKANKLGSKKSSLHLKAEFEGDIGVNLGSVDITVESLLNEKNRAGESVQWLKNADEPLVLIPGHSERVKHVWNSEDHSGLKLKVSVREHKGRVKLDISGKVGPINQPAACLDGASHARLLTSLLLLDDSSETPTRLVFEQLWECDVKHRQLQLR